MAASGSGSNVANDPLEGVEQSPLQGSPHYLDQEDQSPRKSNADFQRKSTALSLHIVIGTSFSFAASSL